MVFNVVLHLCCVQVHNAQTYAQQAVNQHVVLTRYTCTLCCKKTHNCTVMQYVTLEQEF